MGKITNKQNRFGESTKEKGGPIGTKGSTKKKEALVSAKTLVVEKKTLPGKGKAPSSNIKLAPVKETLVPKVDTPEKLVTPKPCVVENIHTLEKNKEKTAVHDVEKSMNEGKMDEIQGVRVLKDKLEKEKAAGDDADKIVSGGKKDAKNVEMEGIQGVRVAAEILEKKVAIEIAEKQTIRVRETVAENVQGEVREKVEAEPEGKLKEELAEKVEQEDLGVNVEVKDVEFAWSISSAKTVQVAGSFNDWGEKLEMMQDDGVWKVAVPLAKGRHAFKFIVDGEWCYDITKENESDGAGNINNIVTV